MRSLREMIIFDEGSLIFELAIFQLFSVSILVLTSWTLSILLGSSSQLSSLSSMICLYLFLISLRFILDLTNKMQNDYKHQLSLIQMNQKKKNVQTNPIKKLNRVKSQDMIPVGSIMQEIGHLKEQLKAMKKGNQNTQVKQNKQNKKANAQLVELQCINRQIKLKTQLQINKLRRAIQSLDQQKISKTINQIFEILNSQMKEVVSDRNRFKMEIQEMIFIYQSYRKEQQEKYKIVMRNNQKLQQEIDLLTKDVARIVQQEKGKQQLIQNQWDQLQEQAQKYKINQEKLQRQNQQLRANNQQLQVLIEEWELQCRALQQKCLNYQRNLQLKAQQLAFLEQDIKYLRLQSQKFKSQKKEIEKLWEKSSLQSKQIKKAMEEQLDKLQREKNKWMNECSLRRQQSQQIQAIQSQKTLLFKEVQQLRNSLTLKCKELAENKSILHESHRKIITLQSENYKMAQQKQKAKRQTQLWEKQMQNLRNEVQQLHSIKSYQKEAVIKSKNVMASIDTSQKKVREQKLKALQDIHNLIKQQKNEIDQDE